MHDLLHEARCHPLIFCILKACLEIVLNFFEAEVGVGVLRLHMCMIFNHRCLACSLRCSLLSGLLLFITTKKESSFETAECTRRLLRLRLSCGWLCCRCSTCRCDLLYQWPFGFVCGGCPGPWFLCWGDTRDVTLLSGCGLWLLLWHKPNLLTVVVIITSCCSTSVHLLSGLCSFYLGCHVLKGRWHIVVAV